MTVVVDIDPKHTLQMPLPEQQVKALGANCSDLSLREGIRVGRLHRREHHLDARQHDRQPGYRKRRAATLR